jgi:CHAT domain-containing protein/uncharacterized protein HemY
MAHRICRSARLSQNSERQGRYTEAEPLFKRALAIAEQALGQDDATVSWILAELAGLYDSQRRFTEAVRIYQRSLAIAEKKSDEHGVAVILNNLALVYRQQGNFEAAEPLFKRSLGYVEKVMGAVPETAHVLNDLARLYRDQDRYAEAEPLFKQALEIRLATIGPRDPYTAETLDDMATLYMLQSRYGEAERLFAKSLAIRQDMLGPDHPDVGLSLYHLGRLHFEQSQWATAANYLRQTTNLLIQRSKRGTIGTSPSNRNSIETEREKLRFWDLVKASWRLAESDTAHMSQLADKMFETTQWSQVSGAGLSLALMAARQAKGDGTLARVVRDRQDLIGQWEALDELLIAAASQPPDSRKALVEQEQRVQLSAINGRIAEIDRTLANGFPEYATLVSPQPLIIGDVQALLESGEALLLFLDTPATGPTSEETFIWVVTKTASRWVRSELGAKGLSARVQKLRAGLDHSNRAARSSGERAAVQLGRVGPAHNFLPFDLGIAHELYAALLGPFEDLIKDKQLLIVPSGPLTSLPFHVLVTEKPDKAIPNTVEGYAKAAWLAKRNALTVLPSVASLAALRRHAKGGRAPEPYLGFGNPLLVGASGVDRRAWSAQSCAEAGKSVEMTALNSQTAGGLSDFFRGGLADVAAVRTLAPLPETANELCAVGHSLGSSDKAIALGQAATEKTVKQMSADGRLARARVVHFATHGLVAGEIKQLAEPALVLSPPETPTEEDDGLLTASEVTSLKFDADWVILSACNTAAGDQGNAQALSGLARAFFYSGARALLVSHWPVNSESAVKLTTRTFAALEKRPNLGRAEAMRAAMLATIAEGGRAAHPAYWAPFVVVGEGAR